MAGRPLTNRLIYYLFDNYCTLGESGKVGKRNDGILMMGEGGFQSSACGNKGSHSPPTTISHPAALPIVEALKTIFDIYNGYNLNRAQFRLATNSRLLITVAVFQALLDHAIAPSSVAKNFWKFLKPFFDDVLQEHGDPTDPLSLLICPRNGQWTTVEDKLLLLSDNTLDDLTQAMNDHAHEWMTWLLLPSSFLSLLPSKRAQIAICSSLPREDPRVTPKSQHAAQKGCEIS